MNETSKTHMFRAARGDYARYLHGNGLDIGCGNDLLKIRHGTVQGWDWKDGDGAKLEGVKNDTYDFVYSSHCLEHIADIRSALFRWVEVIKPKGILYIVVPDYELYEGKKWPSRWNGDHKRAFSLNPFSDWPVVYMLDVAHELSVETDLLELRLEDYGYDYEVGTKRDQTQEGACAQICMIVRKKIGAMASISANPSAAESKDV